MANTTTTKTVAWTRGLNIIHAGQPLDTNGKPVMDNTAVGIVAEDLHAPDKTATAGGPDRDHPGGLCTENRRGDHGGCRRRPAERCRRGPDGRSDRVGLQRPA